MRTRVLRFMLVAALAGHAHESVGHQWSTGKISGFLRSADTNLPVAWANVAIVGTTMGVMSAQDGSFTIPGVPDGIYTVKVMMMGHENAIVDSVRVRGGAETVLSNVIKLSRSWPTKRLKITRVTNASASSVWGPFNYPCTYHGLDPSPGIFTEPRELTDDEIDIMAAFYKEIVVPIILPSNVTCDVTSPLQVAVATERGGTGAPSDFFARLSSDTLRVVQWAGDRDRTICIITITESVSPDTVEVEAMFHCDDDGYGQRALAICDHGRWTFCLSEYISGW